MKSIVNHIMICIMMVMFASCGKQGIELMDETRVKDVTPKQALITCKFEIPGDAISGYSAGILYAKGQTPAPGVAEEVLYGEKVGSKSDFDLKLVHLECGTTYSYCLFVKKDDEYTLGDVRTFRTDDLPRNAIDLGLESDLLWADRNLGADAPEGYGDIYAFGETKQKDVYSAETYKFYTDYSKYGSSAISKYTFADGQTDCRWYDASGKFIGDGKTSLDLEDEVVVLSLGGRWRMPKGDDFQELINSCEIKNLTRKDIGGVCAKSKNGSELFMPNSLAADKFGKRVLHCLYYRTSELWTQPRPHSKTAGSSDLSVTYFAMRESSSSEKLSYNFVASYARHLGLPIRPVYDCNIETE